MVNDHHGFKIGDVVVYKTPWYQVDGSDAEYPAIVVGFRMDPNYIVIQLVDGTIEIHNYEYLSPIP